MGPHFKLLAGILIYECRTVDCILRNFRWQGHRTNRMAAISFNGFNNLRGGLVYNLIIISPQFDSYSLTYFCRFFSHFTWKEHLKHSRYGSALFYLLILVTAPAPTVLPPSLIANLCFSSMAIGAINWTFKFTVSPGITISVPSGNKTSPVTSVVRK